MAFVLRCPEGRGKFPWGVTAEFPRFCPLCRSDIGIDTDDSVISMPSLRSASTKANDALYRQMEKGSEFRAEKAAEMAGCSVEDMAGLKITDMNTGLKPGETAAIEVKNTVTEFMASTGIGGFRQDAGSAYSGAVQTGPSPNAGARMRTGLQEHHARLTGGEGVSDRPALETQAPNYRRRG